MCAMIDNLKLVSLKGKEKTLVRVRDLEIGKDFVLIAGPCTIETEEQMLQTAIEVKKAGANILRGGAFKPRTSPYEFQGLGLEGLKILNKVGKKTGLPVVSEVLDTKDISDAVEYLDILQIGARNMQNFSLLKEVGRTGKPILLKRGMFSTFSEWLNCAEYILNEGNPNVILCERGIRSFETYTRNTLDLSAVPAMKELTHLPIIVDPSHGTGKSSLVTSMSLAAIGAGADGLMIEVHYQPETALSDKDQSLNPKEFAELSGKVKKLKDFMQRL